MSIKAGLNNKALIIYGLFNDKCKSVNTWDDRCRHESVVAPGQMAISVTQDLNIARLESGNACGTTSGGSRTFERCVAL